jgi:hypothetical protein
VSNLTKAFRAHLVALVLKLVDDKKDELVSCKEAIQLYKRLEKVCVVHSDAKGVAILELQRQLRKLRGHLYHVEAVSQKQSTLDSFFTPQDRNELIALPTS